MLRHRAVPAPATGGSTVARPGLKDLFSHRNVPLAMLTLMCAMGGVFVLAAMGPNYLTDYLKLSVQDMGFVFSAVGVITDSRSTARHSYCGPNQLTTRRGLK